jgi:hypothetical protein
VRALTSRVAFWWTWFTASRGGVFAAVFAIVLAFALLGSRTTQADATLVTSIPGIGPALGIAGELFGGGVAKLAGDAGGKFLKGSLEWLFGGLEKDITLPAMRSVTKVIPLPPGQGGLILAIYVIALPIFAAGALLSITQALYGTVGGADPTGSYGRVAFRVLGIVALAAAWYPLMQVAVTVTNDVAQYLISDAVLGKTVQKSFAKAKTDSLAPILMLLVYLVLAVSWLLLVVAKGVITLSFVMLALGGPVVLAISTLPGCNHLLGWLMKSVGTLMGIPALWAFVFGAWAFVGAALYDQSIEDAPSQLYTASLFIAAMAAIYAVTKMALKGGRLGLPAGLPGGGMAKVGMGVATAMAAREGAQAILSAGTAKRVEQHSLLDGSKVRQEQTLRGDRAREYMQRGRETGWNRATETNTREVRENRYDPDGMKKTAQELSDQGSSKLQDVKPRNGAGTQGKAEGSSGAANGAMADGRTNAVPQAAQEDTKGSQLQYDKNGDVRGLSNATAYSQKAGWDKRIASMQDTARRRAEAASADTTAGASGTVTGSAGAATGGTKSATGADVRPGKGTATKGAAGAEAGMAAAQSSPVMAVQQAGKPFSPADRATFRRIASEAVSGGRTPEQAQKNFSNAMSTALSGSGISTSSALADEAAIIATASPQTVMDAFGPAASAIAAPASMSAGAVPAASASPTGAGPAPSAPASPPSREEVGTGHWAAQVTPASPAPKPAPSSPAPPPMAMPETPAMSTSGPGNDAPAAPVADTDRLKNAQRILNEQGLPRDSYE